MKNLSYLGLKNSKCEASLQKYRIQFTEMLLDLFCWTSADFLSDNNVSAPLFCFLKLKAKLSIFVNYLITFKVLTTKPSDSLFFSEFCSGFRNDILENLHYAMFLRFRVDSWCHWCHNVIFIDDMIHFFDLIKYQHSSLGGL